MSGTNSAATPGRRVVRLLSTMLLAAGFLALVWALVIWRWQDPMTAVYTRWEQRKLSGQLETLRATYAPSKAHLVAAVGKAPSPAAFKARKLAVQGLAERLRESAASGQALGRIHVDRLGVDMILVDGTNHDALVRGPGVDRRTHLPGEGQLVYVAGHRTTYGAPFAHIDRLRKGDLIEMEMPYGSFVYRVTSHVIVPADDLARLRSRGREELILQACHPRFSARERYIVYAAPLPASAPISG
jgi:sortase A